MKFTCSVVEPLIIIPLDNTTIVIHEGMNRSFTCEATGYPIPTVTWRRVDGPSADGVFNILTGDGSGSDKILTGGGGVSVNLVITNASSENTGVYMCSANNSVGTVSRNITIVCKYIIIMCTEESLLGTYVCTLPVPHLGYICILTRVHNKEYVLFIMYS